MVTPITYDGVRFYRVPGLGYVPSVTTVLSVISKPGLTAWYGSVGTEEAERITSKALDIGREVHLAIEEFARTGKVVWEMEDGLPVYAPEAERAIRAFLEWHKQNPLRFDVNEQVVWSHLGYAGTLDALGLARLDNRLIICEWKTSKRIYPEYILQVSAYWNAYQERYGVKPDAGLILRLDKEGNGFETYWVDEERLLVAFTEGFIPALRLWKWLRRANGQWAGGERLPQA